MRGTPFVRWVRWSAAAHLALGIALWLALPRLHPPTVSAPSGTAVTLVTLVDAPASEDRRAPLPPPRPSRPTVPAANPITRSAPAPTTQDSPQTPGPEPSLPAADAPQPDAASSRVDAATEPPASVVSPPPYAALPPQDSSASSSADALDEHYRPLVLAILERAKRYPLVAQRRGIEGTVRIAFIINPDGRLSDPELLASSSHRVLDEATLALVRRIGSVPPPPDSAPVRFPASIQYQLVP